MSSNAICRIFTVSGVISRVSNRFVWGLELWLSFFSGRLSAFLGSKRWIPEHVVFIGIHV